LPYAERLARLRAHGVGLWDVIVACRREGSSDGAISDAARGDPARIRRVAPHLALVCFNGGTAASAAPDWCAAGYETLVLPSTSPAYTRPFADKLTAWQALGRALQAARP
jgi:hypoxanthine-DNA glycosylase